MQEMDGAKLVFRDTIRTAEVAALGGLAAIGRFATRCSGDQRID